jgi:16S rRNA C967 or C1407 C5-methylase (RsmB/RsmF family)
VVFAVCSVLPEEAEAVANAVSDVLAPTPFDAPEVEALAAKSPAFRLLPVEHGTDGYFVASFVRR